MSTRFGHMAGLVGDGKCLSTDTTPEVATSRTVALKEVCLKFSGVRGPVGATLWASKNVKMRGRMREVSRADNFESRAPSPLQVQRISGSEVDDLGFGENATMGISLNRDGGQRLNGEGIIRRN